ncbi:uncharacterized protein LOC125178716 [Hyalella azteca]|uniref:Uncharacterized protein LOC125178716 n=1 Tax=Hyalella azteca TaxID=294128 RepID=A0A979FSD6_HYAAZ|nr:uncharacterized protein LOC125178716 [Hyalella azteca]
MPGSGVTAPSGSGVTAPSGPSVSACVTRTSPAGTSTASTTDITYDDINTLKLFMALRRSSPVAKVFAAVFESLSRRGSETLEQYCSVLLGNDYLKSFNKKERDKLLLNTVQDYDITLLYKLLQKCCHLSNDTNFWLKPGDSIENMLYRLKEQRNFFSHEAVQLSKSELDSRLKKIRKLIEEVSDKAGVDRGLKNGFLAELDNISVSTSLQAELADRNAQMKAFKEDIQDSILDSSIAELKDRYSTMRVLSPITWFTYDEFQSITIDKVFTKLTMSRSNTTVDIGKILLVKNERGVDCSTIIITGLAGSGKTSLCRFLIYSWSGQTGEVDELNEYKLLIFIQCRYVKSNGFAAFIKEDLLKTSFYLVPETEVIEMLQRFKPLFVIDGYDEADYAVQNLIVEIHHKFPSTKILITSRPHICASLSAKLVHSLACLNLLNLKIMGFETGCIQEYSHKLFSVLNNASGANAFLDYILKRSKLQSIINLPLTLALLILLWIDDRSQVDEVSSEGQIHVKIIEMMKRRLLTRLGEKPSIAQANPLELENNVDFWLHLLGKIALEGIAKQQLFLDEQNMRFLKMKCKKLSQTFDVEDAMSSIMQCETSISLSSCKKIWSFIHATQQEMMAALYIVKEIEEEDQPFSNCIPETETELSEQMVNVIQFAVEILKTNGSLTEESAKFIASKFPLISEHNIAFIFSILDLVDNDRMYVEIFKKFLDTNSIPSELSFVCMPFTAHLTKLNILSSDVRLTFVAE